MEDVTRRRAVKLTAAGAAAVLAAGSARAQKEEKDCKRYTGSSRKGDIQEALADAIKVAHAAAPGADRQVRWTLKEISGVNGGIDPLNTLKVEIEATVT